MEQKKVDNSLIDSFRLSNYSLPFIMELPLEIHLGWSKSNLCFFFTGWKTLVSMKANVVEDFSYYLIKKEWLQNEKTLNALKQTGLSSELFVHITSSFSQQKKTVSCLSSSLFLTMTKLISVPQKQPLFLEKTKNRVIFPYMREGMTKKTEKNDLSLELLKWKSTVWFELLTKWKKKQVIFGRFLNTVHGGYSIGIGGFVAFLPKSRWYVKSYRLGSLEPFLILNMNPSTKNIVLTGLKHDRTF